jgi:hypothetical protein
LFFVQLRIAPRGAAACAGAHRVQCDQLALDLVWRCPGMPEAYYRQWMEVAREEALHFQLLHERLLAHGHRYGDFPAHDGLWQMAERTREDLLARIALVPRTLEAADWTRRRRSAHGSRKPATRPRRRCWTSSCATRSARPRGTG